MTYLWLKALHLIAVISWMAGMLYLPRLFVYHVNAVSGGELDKTLQVMEKKLLRYIVTPAAIVVLMLWVGEKRGWGLTPEVAAAIVALVGFGAGYLTTERAYTR